MEVMKWKQQKGKKIWVLVDPYQSMERSHIRNGWNDGLWSRDPKERSLASLMHVSQMAHTLIMKYI